MTEITKKKVILLMIPNGEESHFLAVLLSALLRMIMSKHHINFYCLNCLHSLATENKNKKSCENNGFFNVKTPS